MTEFARHSDYQEIAEESSIGPILTVGFPKSNNEGIDTVVCFLADQLVVSFAEFKDSNSGIVAMRLGSNGLFLDYNNKEQVDNLILGLQKMRDML